MASQELLERLATKGIGHARNHIGAAGITVNDYIKAIDGIVKDGLHSTFLCECETFSGKVNDCALAIIEKVAPEILPKLSQLKTGETYMHETDTVSVYVVCGSFHNRKTGVRKFALEDFKRGLTEVFDAMVKRGHIRNVLAAPIGPGYLREEISVALNLGADRLGADARIMFMGSPRN